MKAAWARGKDWLLLVGLTLAAVAVHGFHPAVEDAEIYTPGILKILNPSLFPLNAEFFQSHARLTLFPNLMAAIVRISHIPLDVLLLLCHLLSIFLLLLACLKLARLCFAESSSQWAGVALIAALLTIPVAGTRLFLMDQYFNPRSVSIFCAVFAIEAALRKHYFSAGLWIVLAAAVHPLMAVFVLAFVFLLAFRTTPQPSAAILALTPLVSFLGPPSSAYHEAAIIHPFHYATKWAWYEWLGVFAPLAILWGIGRMARVKNRPALEKLSLRLIPLILTCFVCALAISIPARFEALARLQPLRSLHILYVVFFLVLGCLIGEMVLKKHAWRWIVLFIPLCGGMFYVQRQLFPATPHLELPGRAPGNEWAQAFEWIQTNTPRDAFFALNPKHMEMAGEDEHGFRAIAQRSMLADGIKDSGAVSMFPALAEEWFDQVKAQRGWQNFTAADFRRLQASYGISWVVLEQPRTDGFECPFQNKALSVCRLGEGTNGN